MTTRPNDTEPSWGERFNLALFDPAFPFNLTDYSYDCGNPPHYKNVYLHLGQKLFIDVVVTPYSIKDPVHALSRGDSSLTSEGCRKIDAYFYYDLSVADIGRSTFRSEIGPCPDSNDTGAGAIRCSFYMNFEFASSLVTAHNSQRATNTLRILTDEGSIIGGVLFLTWFLGIFVL